jgi:hypothetical protein
VYKIGWEQWTYSKLSKPCFSEFYMAEISDATYERLRQILEKQNGHAYTIEEAKEIGDGLIDFYYLLIELNSES